MLHRCHWTLRNGSGAWRAIRPMTGGPRRSAQRHSSGRPRPPARRVFLLIPVARVRAFALGRCNYEAGAWKMHTDLADGGIAASDDDLMDARGDQFADDRVASGIIRRDGDGLARLPADGVSRIGGCAGD